MSENAGKRLCVHNPSICGRPHCHRLDANLENYATSEPQPPRLKIRVAKVGRVCKHFCEDFRDNFWRVMNFGYARVSTEGQELENQMAALQQAGCVRLFCEKLSGALRQRPELARMLEQLRESDIVTVTKLDRLARSTRDLLEIADAINDAGAGLRSLSEPWADTTSPAGTMILTVFAGIAEFERKLILERTQAGRAVALQRGVRFGRPVKLSAEQLLLAKRLLSEGQPARMVARTLGVHVATLYRRIPAQCTATGVYNALTS